MIARLNEFGPKSRLLGNVSVELAANVCQLNRSNPLARRTWSKPDFRGTMLSLMTSMLRRIALATRAGCSIVTVAHVHDLT
jgi:hypothetical protein